MVVKKKLTHVFHSSGKTILKIKKFPDDRHKFKSSNFMIKHIIFLLDDPTHNFGTNKSCSLSTYR